MLPRFHAPDLDPDRSETALPADEAHHLTRVLRLGVGDEIAVFDGRGREYRARVTLAAKDAARVVLVEPVVPAPESSVRLTIVQAVLKGEAMDEVVRDATMMGVGAIVPLLSAHVAVRAQSLERSGAVARWRRIALASAKQCRRATLPHVSEPARLADWIAGGDEALRLLFVEPSAACRPVPLRAWLERPAPPSAAVMVGPEGGWAPGEIEQAVACGCIPVTLGGLTLRADAVPVAALALCRFVFGE